MDLLDTQIFGVIGEDGFARLVAAFYRQVPTDDILGPMYCGREMLEAEHRLRDFLVGRFGGPMRYVETRGHPRLRMRHAGFQIDFAARNRWMALMEKAMDEVKLPEPAAGMLKKFFANTATFMMNA